MSALSTIQPLTEIGEVTIDVLRMNDPEAVTIRTMLIRLGVGLR